MIIFCVQLILVGNVLWLWRFLLTLWHAINYDTVDKNELSKTYLLDLPDQTNTVYKINLKNILV